MLPLFLGASAITGAALLLWRVLSAGRAGSRDAVARNLVLGASGPTDLRQAVLARPAGERAVQPVVASLARHARRFTPTGQLDALERRIVVAGGSQRWPLEAVLAAKAALALAGAAVGALYLLGQPGPLTGLATLALVALGFWLPDLLLVNRATKRRVAIRKALADTLDQLTVMVEAGLAFDAAIDRSARTSTGPLAEELRRTMQDVQAGMSRRDALRALAERVDVAELRGFTSAVAQGEQYGIPVARVLRAQAREQRLKRGQRAEEQAMKLPVKLLFPTIIFIFPVLFIVLLGPAALQISGAF